MAKLFSGLLAILAIAGMPLFAVLGAVTILSQRYASKPGHVGVLRDMAPGVFEEKFAGSSILATIPLFVFVGYLMAESKTPQRIVRAATATLGWLPGGLAIVCIMATAMFTMLTGGSGVTIVAIGGLLYPVLIQRGYHKDFALGLVTTAGAVGLLLPPSPLVLIYCLVTGVPTGRAYYATLWPGLALVGLLAGYAIIVSMRRKVPTQKFDAKECADAMWDVKWEALAPLIVLAGMGTTLMVELSEAAAAAAAYTLIVEVYIHKDLTWKKVLKVAKDAISLSGAILAILCMAASLTFYIVDAHIPERVLGWFTEQGMHERWQFLVVMNVFLFIMGALMDAFSVLLVGLPLLVPIAQTFHLHPFYLAAMFLLHLEIAYVTPPIGLNLFISSYRFKRPVVEVYKVVMPFFALLVAGFVLIVLWEPLSTFTVKDEVAALRNKAVAQGIAPKDAWKLECIQQDYNNPRPCQPDDIAKWGPDGNGVVTASTGKDDDGDDDDDDDDLDDDKPATKKAATTPSALPSGSSSASPAPSGSAKSKDDDDEDFDDDD
jgi:C4-dicarboxylate transporter, DctM subunit